MIITKRPICFDLSKKGREATILDKRPRKKSVAKIPRGFKNIFLEYVLLSKSSINQLHHTRYFAVADMGADFFKIYLKPEI